MEKFKIKGTMKNLKYKFDLDCKVAIYVPSTNEVDKPTDNTEHVKDVIKRLSLMFGGATASNAVGGWVTSYGETVIERINIVYSFCTTTQLNDHIEDVIAICEQLKRDMKQEAVTLEVNGQVKFI